MRLHLELSAGVPAGQNLHHRSYFVHQTSLQRLLSDKDIAGKGSGVVLKLIAPLPLDIANKAGVRLLAKPFEVVLRGLIQLFKRRQHIVYEFADSSKAYPLEAKCLWSIWNCSIRPFSFSFWNTTPMLPTTLELSATTWSPAPSTM